MKASSCVDEDCARGGGFLSAARKLVGELSFSSTATLQPSVSSYSVSFVTTKDAKIATGNTDQLNFFFLLVS